MSTRQRVTLIAALVAVIAALLLWRRSHTTSKGSEQQTALAGASTGSAPAPKLDEPAATSVAQAGAATPGQSLPTQKPSPALKRTFEALNHNPIEFYGRALDQFGEPVAGARVLGSVLYNTGTKSGRRVSPATTDASGYFQFGGLEGQSLGIEITKEGYEHRRHNSSFSFSYFEADHKRHQPDPKNPVIFTLWKKQGAESLIHYDKAWRFPLTGGAVRINLVTGKLGGEDADLIVTVSRTPLRMRYGERGFAWKATIDVVGGGLTRVGQRDYYNQAPESGYEPHFEYVQDAQSVRDAQEERIKWTWTEGLSDTFFISSRNGKNFARVDLRIRSNVDRQEGDNEGLIAAVVWLNPNGSRNLEFDPAKAITPPAKP